MPIRVALSTIADGSMYNRHDDTDEIVIANRRRFFDAHGFPFTSTARVDTKLLERATITHDSSFLRYVEITHHTANDGIEGKAAITSDALVTTQKGIGLMLPVADCVGAVLYDPAHSVLMVSHLGRHSLEQQGAQASVDYLQKHYNCNPKDIQVWLTPAPRKEVYQIWALDNKGMKEATFEQLQQAGILPEHITDDPRDTAADPNFYSYSEFLKGHKKEDGDHMIVAVME